MTPSRLDKFLNIGIVVTFVTLVVSIIFLYNWGTKNEAKYVEQVSLNEVLNDTLTIYKGKDGENRARISQFQTARAKDFLKLKTSDAMVVYLQKQVKKYESEIKNGGSVTVADIQAEYKTTVPTEVKETADPTAPVYIGDSKNKFGEWARVRSVATRDSTEYNLVTNDKITLILGREKTGFLGLGKGKPFADITNENPYSTTKGLRSYEVKSTDRKWSIGLGATTGATYLKNNIGWGVTFGATLNYKLGEF